MPRANKINIVILSLVMGIGLMILKFLAYYYTDSSVFLSDALESIVNVVASSFATYSLFISARPKDEDHPYGHGKIEFFSSGLEGVLILLAAGYIIFHAITNFFHPTLKQGAIFYGIGLIFVSSICNGGLGYWIRKEGRKHKSQVLLAEGKHLLLDAQNSLLVILSALVIRFTGWEWMDGVASLLFAGYMIYVALPIIKDAISKLMDAVDENTIDMVIDVFVKNRQKSWIDVHNLRIQHHGINIHIDCHVTLPSYWDLEKVHKSLHQIETNLTENSSSEVEIFIHADPCLPECCSYCLMEDCPIRSCSLEQKIDWTKTNITQNRKHFAIL